MSTRVVSEPPYQRLPDTDQRSTVALPSEMIKARKFRAKMSSRVKIHGFDRHGRRTTGVLCGFKVSCGKVVRRLMDGSCHFNELFAGNYMFMQVTRSPLGA